MSFDRTKGTGKITLSFTNFIAGWNNFVIHQEVVYNMRKSKHRWSINSIALNRTSSNKLWIALTTYCNHWEKNLETKRKETKFEFKSDPRSC